MNQNLAIQKLAEKEGFNLLLLRVKSLDNSETRPFIVVLSDQRANKLFQKSNPTVLDFERREIVRFFEGEEEITNEAIQSSIEYFNKYFVRIVSNI